MARVPSSWIFFSGYVARPRKGQGKSFIIMVSIWQLFVVTVFRQMVIDEPGASPVEGGQTGGD